MTLKYTNRKKQDHYIKVVITKKGAKRYYIVKDKSKWKNSELLNELPQGFEFYEAPDDARVSFRKVVKSCFSEDEQVIVHRIMQKHETIKDFIIDLTKDGLVVHPAHLYEEELIEAGFPTENFMLIQSYPPRLLFTKNEQQQYVVRRFCHISRYYGWIPLETSSDLKTLAEKFCPLINTDELLKFWIEGEEDW